MLAASRLTLGDRFPSRGSVRGTEALRRYRFFEAFRAGTKLQAVRQLYEDRRRNQIKSCYFALVSRAGALQAQFDASFNSPVPLYSAYWG
jgi:hypothetical protein